VEKRLDFSALRVYERTSFRKGRGFCRGDADSIGKRGERMIGKKVLGFAAILFIPFLLITAPVTAAEKTILLNIPGCNA
jgi:hypothetical protein